MGSVRSADVSKPLCTAAAIFCCPIFLRIVDLISSTDFKSVIQHSCGDVERKAKSIVRKERQFDTISPRAYHVLASMSRIFNVFPAVVPFPLSRVSREMLTVFIWTRGVEIAG
jgi:hypothetical protein